MNRRTFLQTAASVAAASAFTGPINPTTVLAAADPTTTATTQSARVQRFGDKRD